ncbi:hypothetical protein FOIG_09281 [Fusarium odoratissimum NRRL 54006]|uniref:Uncharacterized protein n=2 Tax=Fusarium oxysporum species complex TaxID=171631 RepID=X0JQ01_FUSO5|nr:uncharacterized protein FOIG_09281 [Fusarium odoratissimum NRRL 54006]EXL98506.1 hypothetical protein FOIG_09281 [Fusarium odoratissimum NRRL 54006]TXC00824.1 hypothetical protein FocTR4_00008220 [Fusarium oxysporum f. sp. cubense]
MQPKRRGKEGGGKEERDGNEGRAQNSRRRGEEGRRKKGSKWWSLSLIRILEERKEGRSGDGEDEREDEKARVSNGERARVGSVETTEALCLAGGCAWACWGKEGTEAILYAHCAMTR